MLKAANLAGKAINISKTTAAHAWSYSFTSEYQIPHGHAVWLTLPSVFEAHYNALDQEVTDPRGSVHLKKIMARMSEILSLQPSENLSLQLKSCLRRVGIQTEMENFGINNEEKQTKIVRMVNSERMKNNPVNLIGHEGKIFSLT